MVMKRGRDLLHEIATKREVEELESEAVISSRAQEPCSSCQLNQTAGVILDSNDFCDCK